MTQRQRRLQQPLDGRAPGVIIDRHPAIGRKTVVAEWKGCVDSDRAPEQFLGGCELAAIGAQLPHQGQSRNAVRINLERCATVGFGLGFAAQHAQCGTQSRQRNHVAGLEVQRPSITTRGFLESAKLELQIAEIAEAFGPGWRKLDGPRQQRGRFAALSPFWQQ